MNSKKDGREFGVFVEYIYYECNGTFTLINDHLNRMEYGMLHL